MLLVFQSHVVEPVKVNKHYSLHQKEKEEVLTDPKIPQENGNISDRFKKLAKSFSDTIHSCQVLWNVFNVTKNCRICENSGDDLDESR